MLMDFIAFQMIRETHAIKILDQIANNKVIKIVSIKKLSNALHLIMRLVFMIKANIAIQQTSIGAILKLIVLYTVTQTIF